MSNLTPRRSLAIASLVLALAVIGCGGGGAHGGSSLKGASTGSTAATTGSTATSGTDDTNATTAGGTTTTNPDPNFYYSPNSVPDQWIVNLNHGAFEQSDGTNPGNVTVVSTAICADYGLTLAFAADFGYYAVFVCRGKEKNARAMSHDARVTNVGSDGYGSGT